MVLHTIKNDFVVLILAFFEVLLRFLRPCAFYLVFFTARETEKPLDVTNQKMTRSIAEQHGVANHADDHDFRPHFLCFFFSWYY
ncbi:hypothetical protein DID88_007270 [Monilinia fructigena]|uniref:Uncharacterized protein n=1 Tax=Monilinia fructigena TaxID=38457 RepID=A0A395J8V3_9HELO|nr:hypothetical protein DID88_007270 [Monilinia fructigena]